MPPSARYGWLCFGLGALLIIINPIPLGLLAAVPWTVTKVVFEERWDYAQEHKLGLAWVLGITR